ncbi:2-C-methyl-D-erythritol 4-phosphate cytidylyltransferase [Myxococcota bacterium]|nr:2-C-methyl-D-erythritol 4-phosphate cytidylyltransferase [Myxococcota bacterium]
MSVAALVLAAGRGERLGHTLPKAYVPLAGSPILLHALRGLAAVDGIYRLTPVIAAADLAHFRKLPFGPQEAQADRLTEPVFGGVERQESVRAGLESLPADCRFVAVHDAARPLVRPEAVRRVIEVARQKGAALLASPVSDTLKRVREGVVVETPRRSEFWAAQTPQVFAVDLLREALDAATRSGRQATDDAQAVEWLGRSVAVVEGDPDNLKLTHPGDLEVAEAWLARHGCPGAISD